MGPINIETPYRYIEILDNFLILSTKNGFSEDEVIFT